MRAFGGVQVIATHKVVISDQLHNNLLLRVHSLFKIWRPTALDPKGPDGYTFDLCRMRDALWASSHSPSLRDRLL
jgi:hypothetical protein